MTTDTAALRGRYLAVDTTTVCDVLERYDLRDQALSPAIAALSPTQAKLAGTVYTVRGQMMPYEGPADPDKMAAIGGMTPGVVSVWSGDGDGMAYFGELLALGMQVRGCEGIVVNGGVRDSAWIVQHGIPCYAKYRSPVQSITRWKVTGCQVAVDVPGATSRRVHVSPGDFILGDADGVVVVPARLALEVLEEAERITERETSIRTDIRSGADLGIVLRRYGRI